MAGNPKRKKWEGQAFMLYLFMVPTFAILGFVLIMPGIISTILSFFSYELGKQSVTFVGFKNYLDIVFDPIFWNGLRISLIYMGITIPVQFVLGGSIALLLSYQRKYRNVTRILFLLPYMLTPVVAGIQWLWLYNPQFGLINYFLNLMGIHEYGGLLSNPSTALLAIIIAAVWRSTPVVMLFLVTGLESLPGTLLDAAKIDGASKLQELVFIDLPLLRPIILVLLILRSVDAFKAFDMIYVLTGGGPANATMNLGILTYQQSFVFFKLGYGAGISIIMFLVLAALAAIYMWIIK